MARPDPRKLKDEAAEAVAKGKWKKALECYENLGNLEPREGAWPQKAGEMNRKLGRGPEAVASFNRAADTYAQNGFLLKAIAVCKLILEIEPAHTETQSKLASLYAARGVPAGKPRTEGAPAPRATGASPALGSPAAPAPAQRRAPAPAQRAPTAPPVPQATPQPIDDPFTAPWPGAGASSRGPIELDASTVGGLTPPEMSIDLSTPGIDAVAEELEVLPSAELEMELMTEASTRPVHIPPAPPVPPAPPPPRRDTVPSPPPSMSTPPAPGAAAPRAARSRTLPPGATLDSVSLASVLPDARPTTTTDEGGGEASGAFEIPLDEDDLVIEDAGPEDLLSPVARATVTALSKVPLFSFLEEERLRFLIDRVLLVRLEKGQTLFKKGDRGDALYVVAQGSIEVLAEQNLRVALLGEGAFFGEIALLTEQPRSAGIRALEDTDLLSIDRSAMGDLVSDSPDVLKVLLRFMRDRLIETLVRTNKLFAPFSGDERQQLAEKFRFLEVEPGTVVLDQGKRAGGLFVLLAGKADVSVDGRTIATLGPGDLFGEISLLNHGPARASIRVDSKGYLLQLPRADFTEVIMTHPQVLEYINTLAEERLKLIDASHLPVT